MCIVERGRTGDMKKLIAQKAEAVDLSSRTGRVLCSTSELKQMQT